MPAQKSNKSKAAKAAQAILHPKSTLAAAKSNASARSSTESTSASEAAKPTKSPATSIRRAPSNASVSSSASAKPLSRAPSASASPAAKTATLPTAAPAPSVLAPAISSDILSMKKSAIERSPSKQKTPTSAHTASSPLTQPASLPPALAPPQPMAHATTQPTPTQPASTSTITTTAGPYTIDEASASPSIQAATIPSQADPAAPARSSIAAEAQTEAASTPKEEPATVSATAVVNSKTLDERNATEAKDFASEVAAAVASTPPNAEEKIPAAAIAAPTPVTLPIVSKAEEQAKPSDKSNKHTAPSSAAPAPEPTPAAKEVAATAAAVARVSAFTPPELTRVQHNTFVSRPGDPSRAGVRNLDASVLPVPLRPIDRQSGLARSPSHVVIFGWMDAPIRLVAKYAQPYTVLFPDATVLIQLSDGKSYLAREEVRRKQLQHIISEVSSSLTATDSKETQTSETRDVGDSTVTLIDHKEALSSSFDDGSAPEVGGFVIHSFSDGGAGNLALFLDEMSRKFPSSSSTPAPKVHSLIMDSSPGKSNPRTGSYAFTMHLSNRPRLRAIVQFLVFLGLYIQKIWTKLTGQPQRGELMRKRLNSLRSWGWVTASYSGKAAQSVEKKEEEMTGDYPPRMYMYTKADKLIPWQFVEEHAKHLAEIRGVKPRWVQMENEVERAALLKAVDVKSKGEEKSQDYKVELRRWDTPPHCSIGRSDFEGYWAAAIDFYTNVLSK